MADEKKEAPEATAESEEKPKRKLNLKALLMVGGCLAAQAIIVLVVLFFARAANETPQVVEAAATVSTDPEMVEISVTPKDPSEKVRAINAKKGRLVYWGLKVFLQIRKADFELVKEKLITNENYVKQEIARIVADCEPFLLEQEADHATLKRQIRFALNSVLGKGTINEVLVSECIPQNLE